MIISHPNQRIGVFIDVQNLYYSARAMYGTHVNFGRILELATGERQLIRAMAYVIRSEAPKEQAFFDALGKVGFEVQMKDIQIFASGQKKGDWDVGIAVDAIKIADRLDVVVLVTGDGDFTPLVTYLKENKGCRVEGIAFGRSASAKLIENLDHFYDLDANPRPFLIQSAARTNGQEEEGNRSQSANSKTEPDESPLRSPLPEPEESESDNGVTPWA